MTAQRVRIDASSELATIGTSMVRLSNRWNASTLFALATDVPKGIEGDLNFYGFEIDATGAGSNAWSGAVYCRRQGGAVWRQTGLSTITSTGHDVYAPVFETTQSTENDYLLMVELDYAFGLFNIGANLPPTAANIPEGFHLEFHVFV